MTALVASGLEDWADRRGGAEDGFEHGFDAVEQELLS
jgi:hypothetical protein